MHAKAPLSVPLDHSESTGRASEIADGTKQVPGSTKMPEPVDSRRRILTNSPLQSRMAFRTELRRSRPLEQQAEVVVVVGGDPILAAGIEALDQSESPVRQQIVPGASGPERGGDGVAAFEHGVGGDVVARVAEVEAGRS